MLVSGMCNRAVVSCFVTLLAGVVSSSAGEWRGIAPLHSTRADVERLLGPPSTDRSDFTFYELAGERVSFHFAKGPCGTEPGGWNVPLDTVLSIRVIPKPNLLRLADLKLDESKYKKVRDKHVRNIVHYVDEVEGVSYQVDTSADGMVTLVRYFPAAKDNYLQCPTPDEVLEDTTMVDSYSDISFEGEKERLDRFAERLRRHNSVQGYVMAYAGKRARAGEAEARGARAKEYLVKVRGIDARSVVAIDGGHREGLTVELYLVPYGEMPPLSTPTVDPAEVEIIKPAGA